MSGGWSGYFDMWLLCERSCCLSSPPRVPWTDIHSVSIAFGWLLCEAKAFGLWCRSHSQAGLPSPSKAEPKRPRRASRFQRASLQKGHRAPPPPPPPTDPLSNEALSFGRSCFSLCCPTPLAWPLRSCLAARKLHSGMYEACVCGASRHGALHAASKQLERLQW